MSRGGKGIREKDASGEDTESFLDLLTKVQGAQYDNQRCTLPPKVTPNLTNTNGDIPVITRGDFPTSSIPSTSRQNKVSNGTLPRPQTQQAPLSSRKSSSPSPSPSPVSSSAFTIPVALPVPELGAVTTPSRKSMDALREVIAKDGPYPLVISGPTGGFWVENGEYESARTKNGLIKAPEISTEHFRVESDATMFAYTRHFLGKDHRNYVGRDSKAGGLILSILFEEDHVNKAGSIRMMYRTQKETVHKLVPTTVLSEQLEPEQYMKYMAQFTLDKDINPEGVTRIMYPKVYELFKSFDEHSYVKGHKIGVVYQKVKQVSEEEMFSNVETPKAFEEFLDMIATKVKLKGFEGFRGGLDTASDQTGEYSYYTTHKDKEIMFHVSTLLPYNPTDSQQVQRKRHIGNDMVVLVFQDKNTTFCPGIIRSHFIHSYIIVQVECPNTDHVVYKVAVAARNDVDQFDPPLPHPTVFQKGPEFREWLVTKLLNAESSCHRAPDFQKLATRTRTQLFSQLVEEVTHYRDDIDGVKSFTLSDRHSGLSLSPSQQRRKTLSGIFGNKESITFGLMSKRKSIGGRVGGGLSPKAYRPLAEDAPMTVIGSTPDLAVPGSSRLTASGSSVEEHPSEVEEIHAVDSASQGSKKVKRRFTFKRDKNKSKGHKEAIEESSEHPKGFREAFNSSPSPNKTDGQNSENSSLASNSALRLSVPSDLHQLNYSNSASAENLSVSPCGDKVDGGKPKLRGSVSAEFELQEARVPFDVEDEEVDRGGEHEVWSRDSQPKEQQDHVTAEAPGVDGDGSGGVHHSSEVDDISRPKVGGGDKGQAPAFLPALNPLGDNTPIQGGESSSPNTEVFVFPSPVHSTVSTSASTLPPLRSELSSDIPATPKTALSKKEASATSSHDHHNLSSSSSSSTNSTPTKTKTVTINRRTSDGRAIRKLPSQKDILSRYGRVSVSSDMEEGLPLKDIREAEISHARSSSDVVVSSKKASHVSTPALCATPPSPPAVLRPMTSLGFATAKSPRELEEEEGERIKSCSTESLLSAIENSQEVSLVQTLIGEVTRLQEQNTKLWKENTKLSAMNKVMVVKYKKMKQQLEESTVVISQLRSLHPEYV